MFHKSRRRTLKVIKTLAGIKGTPLEVFSCFEKGIYSVMPELPVAVQFFSALLDIVIATAR